MQDLDIDAVINENIGNNDNEAVENEVIENEINENDVDQEVEGQQEGDAQGHDTPFPKKAVNAISRRDKQIAKLKAELAEFKSMQEKAKAESDYKSSAPNEDDFDNYGDYLKAQILHELGNNSQQKQEPQQYTPEQQAQAQWYQERESQVATKAQEYSKSNPEFANLINEYSDVLDTIPPQVERLFFELNDASAAFYALAKDGLLENVVAMSPAMAASHILQAEKRGIEYLQTKKVTSAPAPIRSAKGAGKHTKTVNSMSGEELLNWLDK